MKTCRRSLVLWIVLLCSVSATAQADEARVGVAANFVGTLTRLARVFEAKTGHKITESAASTGQLYAQIRAGAPFDIFFSADVKRPSELVEAGLAVKGTEFVYAKGKLVLWSPGKLPSDLDKLGSALPETLAIADPRTAPYGAVARDLLAKLGLWDTLESKGRIAVGGSVTQAQQYVMSGSAQAAFLALSQVIDAKTGKATGSYLNVPTTNELDQSAVLLTGGKQNPAAVAFLEFVRRDPEARSIIESSGYGLP